MLRRSADVYGEFIAGVIALVLIGADVWLTVEGKVDTGLQASVPIIVAFYFGGRVSSQAWQRRRVVEGDNENGNIG